jgi:hypothetical protein
MFSEIINPHDFCVLPQEVNLGSHIVTSLFTVPQNPVWKVFEEPGQQLLQKELR